MLVGIGSSAGIVDEPLEAHVASDGVEIRGGDPERGRWDLGLRLAAWGRGDFLRPAARGEVASDDERIRIDRGPVIEWYVNDERGVEQGFTVDEPPSRGSVTAPLRLDLAVEGGFACEVLAGERDARFTRADGTQVLYTGLRAWDAVGRELDAHLRADPRGLSILVEDERAAYPITIDPWIWVERLKLLSSDGETYDDFGGSVSISGDTLLVGAPGDNDVAPAAGSAYVYVGSGTHWTEQAKLTAAVGVVWDRLGEDLDIDGDTALAGAYAADVLAPDSGEAHVFVRTGTVWTRQAGLTASDGAEGDWFGASVALDANTALVGAPTTDDLGYASGSAYVFVRSGSTWTQEAELLAEDGQGGAYFGISVALDGDTALIGARGESSQGFLAGAAYVFVRSGSSWSQRAKLLATPGDTDDRFGYSVALEGDTALVAAPFDDAMGGAGSVYVFVDSGSGWSQQAWITPVGSAQGAQFGMSLDLRGDTALVGAPRDAGGGYDMGAAYLFQRTAFVWDQHARLMGAGGAVYQDFGRSVALDDTTVFVGMSWDSALGNGAGSVRVFEVDGAAAHARYRNDAGETNPYRYFAVPPVMGEEWTATIDVSGTGNFVAGVMGFALPLEQHLPVAAGWLLIDPLSPGGELLGIPPAYGYGLHVFTSPIPADPSLAGFVLSTQGAGLGGANGLTLFNAYDLFVGH